MGFSKEASFLFFIIFAAHYYGLSFGEVYKVGDSTGWTATNTLDYYTWASSKTFVVGDTLIFEYDPELHDVMRVSREDYHGCNATSPIATYTTGNDTFTIKSTGHYYFLCGIPGHCEAGQKVDIRVPNSTEDPKVVTTRAPIGLAPLVSPPIGLLAPSPAQSSGLSLVFSRVEKVMFVLGICVYVLVY